jgi:thymidylate synthase
MKQYLELLSHVLEDGMNRSDRTGVGTRGVFGAQMRLRMSDGYPLLTTKKVHWKSVVHELLWFLRGDTNVKYLQEHDVKIWNAWADENGELGPVYGKQWRDFNGVDQIERLIAGLKEDPFGRRHIVTAWNPADVPKMKLPPCHCFWQCYVREGILDPSKKLSLHLYMRSTDIFLGLPFNIASYALLLGILARLTNMIMEDLVISFGDLHLYRNHIEQAKEQLERKPDKLPRVSLTRPITSLADLRFDDFNLIGYDPQPAIKAPIAV